ncbi:MAG: glycosyltransferase family 4 protein [bacterium]
MKSADSTQKTELILGNSNKRFSGVTSTMLQTLPTLENLTGFRVLGKHHLPDPTRAISFAQAIKLTRTPLAGGEYRVFHARRNDEMIQALLLRDLFKAKLKILFTSTAQRHHTRFTRWLMTRMDKVISTCQGAAQYLETPPSQIIPHGVDTSLYTPSCHRRKLISSLGIRGERAIGIFGRVRPQKGVDLFVQACISVLPNQPDVTAVVVGSVTPKHRGFLEDLKKQVKTAGLEKRILFLGEQPFEAIPPLFRAMSLVAALSDNEGFGLTVLEAMSSGAAVLATDAGAWKEVVREGIDGHVVPARDADQITRQLKEMLSNPEMLDKMGENGRQRVLEHYTVEREARELHEVYRGLQKPELHKP